MITPTKEDIAKLHAEVNIYINQRWTLQITSISIVGAVLAWISQKVNPTDPLSINVLFLGTALLLLFLIIIVSIENSLEISQTGPVTFLKVTGASPYELALEKMRGNQSQNIYRVSGQRRVFTALGLLVAMWPFVIGRELTALPWVVTVHLVTTVVFVLYVLLVVPRWSQARRARISAAWRAALASETDA